LAVTLSYFRRGHGEVITNRPFLYIRFFDYRATAIVGFILGYFSLSLGDLSAFGGGVGVRIYWLLPSPILGEGRVR
jgi:hypothetical protein